MSSVTTRSRPASTWRAGPRTRGRIKDRANLSLRGLTHQVSSLVERPPPFGWKLSLCIAASLLLLLVGALARIVATGIGEWGNNQSVGWAWDIAGFVFWIGIGHAGTLISAILYLLRQTWRTSISRAAEAMTIFAVATAAIYPLFHIGRVWLAYWFVPWPNTMQLWPNWTSPLLWDAFAITTYAIVSCLFWYVGLVPDLATLRDRARSRRRRLVFGILSLGWRGSQRHWHQYEQAYLLLAGLSTPLVLSVHTIVSFDFAVSIIPGWHSTIFPPYFVAGAVLSGFAMVVLWMVVVRRYFHLERLVTLRHLENMNKVILATATMLGYAYATEVFLAWYGNDTYERFTFATRAVGPYGWAYWCMIAGNVLLPQLFWVRRIRRSVPAMVLVGLCVLFGMWLERFVIIVTSLHRDFLPSSWIDFRPTLVDLSTFAGTFGLFSTLFLLFLRYVPVLAVAEIKAGLTHPDPAIALAVEPPTQHSTMTTVRRPSSSARPTLLVGWFSDTTTLTAACVALRDAGHPFDAHSPFPVHGLARLMDEDSSPIPAVAFGAGCFGALLGITLQWWTASVAYPLELSNLPRLPFQAWLPITFEVTILFAALGCFVGLWWVNRLPQFDHPVMAHPRFARCTCDRFFVSVISSDPEQFRQAHDLLTRFRTSELLEVPG